MKHLSFQMKSVEENFLIVSHNRDGLENLMASQEDSQAKINKLLSATESRERGQDKTNERIDEHIQVCLSKSHFAAFKCIAGTG